MVRTEVEETIMKLHKILLGGLAGAMALAAGAAQADPVKIRVAYVVPVANWAPMIMDKLDLAKHNGKSYTVEAVRY